MAKALRFPSDRLLIALLILQVIFWYGIPSKQSFTLNAKPETFYIQGSRHKSPRLDIVPNVPREGTVKALAFGDEEFYFRVLALQLQNSGDTFGRFTSLMKYDYPMLQRWFFLLDTLDARSDFVPALASYVFGQTPVVKDIRYVVDYLDTHASRDPKKKWWWYTQAIYLANHKLKDNMLAKEIAMKLYHNTDAQTVMPMWARQLPAFILEDLGEKEASLAIIKSIAANVDQISDQELSFMRYFITERLGKMEQDLKFKQSNGGK